MTRTTSARLTPPIRLSECRGCHHRSFPKTSALRAILCFSRNWDNLLLWSHYGDRHMGVCLGFDIPAGEPGPNYDTDVPSTSRMLFQRHAAPRISPTSQTDWYARNTKAGAK